MTTQVVQAAISKEYGLPERAEISMEVVEEKESYEH